MIYKNVLNTQYFRKLKIIINTIINHLASMLSAIFQRRLSTKHLNYIYSFSISRLQELQQLTKSHVDRSNNLETLITNINVFKINENPNFREFMRKLAKFLHPEQIQKNPYLIQELEKIVYEIRRFSSAQLHANSSDILNYVLFFKKMKDYFKERYSPEGFEFRAAIVAENIPKIASIYNHEPPAIGLLHYLSTRFDFSKAQLKKNIYSYLIRYYMNNPSRKSNMDIDLCLPLLSASQYTSVKTTMQSQLYQISEKNLNRRWWQIKQKLGIGKLVNKKSDQFSMFILGKKLNYNQDFGKSKNDSFINTMENFVKITDLFNSLLRLDYRYFIYLEQPNYLMTKQLNQYFLMVFMLSSQMEIQLQVSPLRSFLNTQQQKQTKIVSQKVSLWKIAAALMEGISMRKLYVNKSGKLASVILGELLSFYSRPNMNIDEANSKKMSKIKRNKIIRANHREIFKIISCCPEYVFENVKQSAYNSQNNMSEILEDIIKEIIKKIDDDSSSIRYQFVKLYRAKSNLFSQQQQWKKMFKTITKQDSQLIFFQIYFLIAQISLQNPNYRQMIPINDIINKLEKQKFSIEAKEKLRNLTKSQTLAEKKKRIVDRDNLQTYLLKTHALVVFLGLEKQYPLFQSQQFENIFAKWMKPYSKFLLADLEQTYRNKSPFQSTETHSHFQFEEYQHHNKPLAFIERYQKIVFLNTLCYYQFTLISKVLNHHVVKEWLLKFQIYKQINFFAYFNILLLGLADHKNFAHYTQIYPISEILNINLRKTIFFNGMKQYIFEQLQHPQQLQYILEVLNKGESVHQARDYLCRWGDKFKTSRLLQNQNSLKPEQWKSCQKIIIQFLYKDLINPNNSPASSSRRFVFLMNYLCNLNQTTSIRSILPEQMINNIKNIPIKVALNSVDHISLAIGKMDELQMLDKQLCIQIEKKIFFKQAFHLGYYFLKSYSLEYGSKQYEQEVIAANTNLYIPNATYYTFIILIRFMSKQNYSTIKKILFTYYHKQHRDRLIKQFNIMKNKMKIDDTDISEEQKNEELKTTTKQSQLPFKNIHNDSSADKNNKKVGIFSKNSKIREKNV